MVSLQDADAFEDEEQAVSDAAMSTAAELTIKRRVVLVFTFVSLGLAHVGTGPANSLGPLGPALATHVARSSSGAPHRGLQGLSDSKPDLCAIALNLLDSLAILARACETQWLYVDSGPLLPESTYGGEPF